jgi:hypothetical protein
MRYKRSGIFSDTRTAWFHHHCEGHCSPNKCQDDADDRICRVCHGESGFVVVRDGTAENPGRGAVPSEGLLAALKAGYLYADSVLSPPPQIGVILLNLLSDAFLVGAIWVCPRLAKR